MQYAHSKDATHIICDLCKHHCVLKEDGHGICGINYNINGELVNKTYNHPSAIHLDPIEKKPLYHFLPASKSLSIGTVGCNFRCPFCQNYTISQTTIVDESVVYTPQKIVELALAHGAQSISYTYNEPTIWYPYARDIGLLAKEHGLKNVFVSSGYESEEVLSDMPGWVDAANIDLKSFDANYYKHVLKTELAGVLATLRTLAKSSVWLEVTTLLIPDVNDSHAEIEQMAQFMACEVGIEVPWHFSAFHPDYKMLDTPNTSPQKLLEAKEIAQKAGMKYVYLGNIAAHNDTYCPKCNALLIKRYGFGAEVVGIKDGRCTACERAADVIL